MISSLLFLETDQTDCFDESGMKITCHNSGHDEAVIQVPQIESHDRFSVMDDVVLDKLTGLFWHINADIAEFPLTWKEAFEFILQINNSRLSGINEWRLPARKELFSLLSHQFINPALPKSHPFINVFNGYYWTRTESSRLMNQAWYIHFGGGKVYRGMKHGSYMVWPVSGQVSNEYFIKNRFIANGESLYDRITCRYWFAFEHLNDCAMTWKDAIRAVENLNIKLKTDHGSWRLPNVRELDTLVDDRNHSPAFVDGFFLKKVQEGYWSSTTSMYEPRYAWVLYPRDGAIGVGYKANADFYFLAVHQ